MDPTDPAHAPPSAPDPAELSGCTCLHLRKASRRVTQLFDQHLAPVGLTSGQFSLLSRLYGAQAEGRPVLPLGTLAELQVMDPTTLNRNLKPLLAAGLVADGRDASDRRVRTVTLTGAGRSRLLEAVPYWRKAQARMAASLGPYGVLALTSLLNLSVAKVT
jgi:DNA-binding MarR family transcriptional regulator